MKKRARSESAAKLKRSPLVKKLIEKAKANGKVIGAPADTAVLQVYRKSKPRFLKDYEKRSKTDLFSTGRVVSGGGPGTGKRR